MSISAISSSATNPLQATQPDNGWQQFITMADAIQQGDLGSAQDALTGFTQSQAGQVASQNPDSPLAQTLNQIEQSLQSGDTSGAQQALAALRPHHGHHHGGAKPQASAPTAPTTSTSSTSTPVDPNAPGATLDLTV